MKVLLINPPAFEGVAYVREGRCMQRKGAWTTVWPPISLVSVAAVLRNDGHEVKLIDGIASDTSRSQLSQQIASFKPNAIIINTATPSIVGDLSIAKMAKSIDLKIFTAAFGMHVTALPAESLELQPELDACIRGEPEETARELIHSIAHKKDLSKVKGISFRAKKVIHNEDRPFIENLDKLPWPARDLLDKTKYVLPFTGDIFTTVLVARGCPFNCTFCEANKYYGKKFRMRSVNNVVDELEHLTKEGITNFLFWSDTFTANKKWGMAVCDEILKRGLKIKWVTNSRVDTIDEEFLRKMKQAGCWMLGFGVESGDQTILNNIRKGITLEKVRSAIGLTKKVGIQTTLHFILGLPGETKGTMEKTIRFAKELDPEFVQFYCAIPYPGTDFGKYAKEQGWVLDAPWEKYEQLYSILDRPGLSHEDIMKARSRAYREFFMRPSKVLQHIKDITSWNALKQTIATGLSFMDWV